MWRVLLLALLLIATPAQATVLWFSGHEQGGIATAGQYEGLGDCLVVHHNANILNSDIRSVTASGVSPYTGAYLITALTGASGDTAYCQITNAFNETTIYSRFRLAVNDGGGMIASTLLRAWQNAAASHSVFLYLGTNFKFFANFDVTTFATGTTALSQDTWYLIETKVVVNSATVSGMELKINGATEFSVFNQNFSTLAAVAIDYFGSINAAAHVTTSWDDIMVCNTAYCPAGRALARQGTSGSPTSTAWTKTNCTSSLIENCWSQTPVDFTPLASNAVASDAQTMIVHDFATTQTGHGTETIGNTSTINACKTAMIAVSGTAAAPLSIRRRLSGSNTDTAKTLTTSAAYYDDGPAWTTTAGVLGNSANMEIGAVHGSGSATDTVYEQWLICDFLNASVAPKHRVIQQ